MPAVGGGGTGGGGATSTSNFAAAARVLFQSAQKIGAVKPLNKTGREYAQQLAEIQKHSRKRGGSLGSVSYNVAEFLNAQRLRPHTQAPKSQSSFPVSQSSNTKEILQKSKLPSMSIAKPVPLLDFVDKVYHDKSNKHISDKTSTEILTSHPHETRLTDRSNKLIEELYVSDRQQRATDRVELQSNEKEKRQRRQEQHEQQESQHEQKNIKMQLTPFSSSSAADSSRLIKAKEEIEMLKKRQMEPHSAISRRILTDMIRKHNINSLFDRKNNILDSTIMHREHKYDSKIGEKVSSSLFGKKKQSETEEENKQENWRQELISSLEQKKYYEEEQTLHSEENAKLGQHWQKEKVIDKTRTTTSSDSGDNKRETKETRVSQVAMVEDEPMFTIRKDVDVGDTVENLTSAVKSNLSEFATTTSTPLSSEEELSSELSMRETKLATKLNEPPPLVKSVMGAFGEKQSESAAMMPSATLPTTTGTNSSSIVFESMLKPRKARPKVKIPIAITTRTSSKENEEQSENHKLTLEINKESEVEHSSSSDMLNLGLDVAITHTSRDHVADAAVLSVDTWEQQREQEIERLRRKQQDEEEERLAELRAEQQRMEGVEWVRKRSQETKTSCLTDSEELTLMRGVQFKSEMQESMKDFAKLTELGTRVPAPLLTVAAATTAYRIRCSEPNKHEQLTSSFVNILEKANLPSPVAKRVKLKVMDDDEEFLQTFCKLSSDEMHYLDRNTVIRAIFALTHVGRWQEAINVAKESRTYLNGSVNVVPLALARAALRLKEEDRAQVAAYVRSTLEEANKMNYEAKLALAGLEGSIRRRHALIQLTSSPDADERVFASLIYNSDREQIGKILEDVEQRGLNSHDPIILRAVANRSIDAQNPMEVYKEVKKQISNIGVRPMHVEVIANALRIHPTSEFVSAAVELLKLVPSCYVNSVCKKVFPVMHTASLHSEIVELYEHFDEEVDFTKSFPKYTPFINEALKNLGRPPISTMTLKDIGFDAMALNNTSQKEGKSNQKVMSAYEMSEITERMLTYAKEKNWQEAHKVVKELGLISADNVAAITLLYNCALGAAVGEPNVMKSVYSLMVERNVRVNVTTVNTILSGYGKANLCDEALHFYNETNNANKDTNTYLMALTILGKNRKWEQAMSIYEDACKKLKKPPLTVYTIAIAATAADDWQSTFRVFEEMIKAYGNNVKENITKQVIRSLERNKRSVELMKVAELLKKKRKVKEEQRWHK